MPKYRVPFLSTRAHPCHPTQTISADKLARLIGTANAPALIDVRTDEDFAADPRLIPGAVRRKPSRLPPTGARNSPAVRPSSSACAAQKLAQGTAAWLRHADVAAETLEGGFEGWKAAKLPLVPRRKLPPRDAQGPHGLGDAGAAEDRPHRLPLADPPLRRSERGVPVRGAVRGGRGRRALQRRAVRHRERVLEPPRRALHLRRDDRGIRPGDAAAAAAGDHGARRRYRRGSISSPEAPGLLAASLGLSRMYDDDLEQLEAGMLLYDAFYRWCRDATGRNPQLADQQGEAVNGCRDRARSTEADAGHGISFGEAFRVWLRVALL